MNTSSWSQKKASGHFIPKAGVVLRRNRRNHPSAVARLHARPGVLGFGGEAWLQSHHPAVRRVSAPDLWVCRVLERPRVVFLFVSVSVGTTRKPTIGGGSLFSSVCRTRCGKIPMTLSHAKTIETARYS